jgi:hypothetical protein
MIACRARSVRVGALAPALAKTATLSLDDEVDRPADARHGLPRKGGAVWLIGLCRGNQGLSATELTVPSDRMRSSPRPRPAAESSAVDPTHRTPVGYADLPWYAGPAVPLLVQLQQIVHMDKL